MSTNQTPVLTACCDGSRLPYTRTAPQVGKEQIFVRLRRTLRETAWQRRPLAKRTASWVLNHGHRAFWVGRWAQVLGPGAWISATALF